MTGNRTDLNVDGQALMGAAYATVQRYAAAGLCVLPLRSDGSKAPALPTWTPYQSKRPTDAELATWFRTCEGVGLVTGAISGQLEVLDFDDGTLLEPWAALVDAELPRLLATLPLDDHGHVYYRCAEIGGNLKLAEAPDGVDERGKPRRRTLIETRGKGGFIITPPTAGRYHPKGRGYTMLRGDLEHIPTITPEQRVALLAAAQAFDLVDRVVREAPRAPGANAGNRPGDLWAAATSWADVLTPHGWTALRTYGDTTYWQRPGKDGPGCSATTGYGGHEVLYVFSCNASPFEPRVGYQKFTCYAMLEHNDDWRAATRAVVALGYGEPAAAPLPECPGWVPRDGGELDGVSELPPEARPCDAPIPGPKPQAPEAVTTWADLDGLLGPITWGWERWLAPGFVHLLASKSGLGKSTLAMRVGASYMRGDPWPDGSAFGGEQGGVLWLETENAQALNLARAKAWGLPLELLINPFADPLAELRLADQRHRRAIAERAARPDVRLVVLDSLSGGWAGRDENSADVLELMKWFAALARDTGKPFLVTHHLRKKGQQDVDGELDLDMLRGSSAVVQVARLVWALDRPSKTDAALRLQVLKSNLARFPGPLGMAISDDGRVIFAGEPPAKPTKESREQAAEAFLLDLLKAGPLAATAVWASSRAAGIAESTLKRAKETLGVDSDKRPGGWIWFLPGVDDDGLPGF